MRSRLSRGLINKRQEGGGRGRGEDGQAIAWFLTIMPLILILIILVVDGGRLYVEYVRARNVANLAAQAGAQMVDVDEFSSARNLVVIDGESARRTVEQYLAWNGVDPRNEAQIRIYRDAVQVCVREEVELSFAGLLGLEATGVTGCSRAYPAGGISREGQ